MRSRISIGKCVRRSVRPSVTQQLNFWVMKFLSKILTKQIKNMKLCHWRDHTNPSTRIDRRNASDVKTLLDLFFNSISFLSLSSFIVLIRFRFICNKRLCGCGFCFCRLFSFCFFFISLSFSLAKRPFCGLCRQTERYFFLFFLLNLKIVAVQRRFRIGRKTGPRLILFAHFLANLRRAKHPQSARWSVRRTVVWKKQE